MRARDAAGRTRQPRARRAFPSAEEWCAWLEAISPRGGTRVRTSATLETLYRSRDER